MSKPIHRPNNRCQNDYCGGDLFYKDWSNHVDQKPIWVCACCGGESKRQVRISAKQKAEQAIYDSLEIDW